MCVCVCASRVGGVFILKYALKKLMRVGEGVFILLYEWKKLMLVYVYASERVCANEYSNRHFQVLISSIGNYKKFLHIYNWTFEMSIWKYVYVFSLKKEKNNELVNMNWRKKDKILKNMTFL